MLAPSPLHLHPAFHLDWEDFGTGYFTLPHLQEGLWVWVGLEVSEGELGLAEWRPASLLP